MLLNSEMSKKFAYIYIYVSIHLLGVCPLITLIIQVALSGVYIVTGFTSTQNRVTVSKHAAVGIGGRICSIFKVACECTNYRGDGELCHHTFAVLKFLVENRMRSYIVDGNDQRLNVLCDMLQHSDWFLTRNRKRGPAGAVVSV